MNTRSSWTGGSVLAALLFGLVAVPEATARGGRGGGGHSGGHAMRAPHVSAANRAYKAPSYKAPRMPRAAAPSRSNNGQMHSNNAQTRSNNAQTRSSNAQARSSNAQTRSSNAQTRASNAAATTGTTSTTTGTGTGLNTTGTTRNSSSPFSYTYGSGANTRHYRAYGYGQGYRNRYNGNRSAYGRSQGNNRAIVARLRSAHSSLARINHDYNGHRSRSMHQISMAIRQLSHRSMVYGNGGFANGVNNGMNNGLNNRMNNGMAVGRRQGAGGAAGRRNQRMPQGQSDARMSQALRTLQGVNMQLSSQGTNTSGHARARGHVQHAMHEINTALTIR